MRSRLTLALVLVALGALAPPAAAQVHRGQFWSWSGPAAWDASYGAYGITVSSPTGASALDLGFSSILCTPGANVRDSVNTYLADQRRRLRQARASFPPARSAPSPGSARTTSGRRSRSAPGSTGSRSGARSPTTTRCPIRPTAISAAFSSMPRRAGSRRASGRSSRSTRASRTSAPEPTRRPPRT